MKKLLILTLLILSGCTSNESLKGRDISEGLPNDLEVHQDFESHADYAIPTNLGQLEDEVSDIVYVKMIENKEIGGWVEDDYNTTVTQVEVLDVFKGNTAVGQNLLISESYYLYEGKLETVEGYVPMESNEEYLLFLVDSDTESDLKLIQSMGFGKYHFDKQATEQPIQSFSTLGEVKEYGLTHGESADLYNTIHEQILNKYNK